MLTLLAHGNENLNLNENENENYKMIAIIKLGEEDLERFRQVINMFKDVFEIGPFQVPESTHLQRLLGKSDFLVFAAIEGDKVVGGLTAHVLDQYYAEKPSAYIYDLAVDTNYQRQGIGTKLITEVTDYCRDKGFGEVFVQAEKVDDYAIDFYRSIRPTEEVQAVHFSYILDKNTTELPD